MNSDPRLQLGDDDKPMDNMRKMFSVFIGGVPSGATSHDVCKTIGPFCGYQHWVRLAEAPEEFDIKGHPIQFAHARHRGHGTVTFTNVKDKEDALRIHYFHLNGRRMEIKPLANAMRNNPDCKKTLHPVFKLFVAITSNRKSSVICNLVGQEATLKSYFSKFGEVDHVNVSSKPGEGTFAFIVFLSSEGPKKALDEPYHEIKSPDGFTYNLVCKIYRPREKRGDKDLNYSTKPTMPKQLTHASKPCIVNSLPSNVWPSHDTNESSSPEYSVQSFPNPESAPFPITRCSPTEHSAIPYAPSSTGSQQREHYPYSTSPWATSTSAAQSPLLVWPLPFPFAPQRSTNYPCPIYSDLPMSSIPMWFHLPTNSCFIQKLQ